MPSFLLLASLALQSPTVGFAADAVTVGDLVKELARQSETVLKADPIVASEPLIVQFEKQPVDEVLKHIALVTGAEWREEGGTRVLGRSASLRTEQEKAERRKLADRLTQMLDLRQKRFEASGPFSSDDATRFMDRYRLAEMKEEALYQEYERMAGDNPVLRTSVAILRTLDPTLLVRMRIGQRLVLSDVPTRMQTSLSKQGREALTDLRKEIVALEEAKKAVGAPKKPFVNFAGLPVLGPGTLADGYGKTVLAVQRTGGLQFTLTFTMVTRDGRGILQGSGDLPERTNPYQAGLPQKEKALELTDEMRAFGTLTNRVGVKMGSSRRIKLADGRDLWAQFWVPFEEDAGDDPVRLIRPKLADPVLNDPIGLVPGPLLRQVATTRGVSLMARLGDGTVTQLGRLIALDKLCTQDGLMAALTASGTSEENRIPAVVCTERDGWLDIAPYLPVATQAGRIDRRALAKLIVAIRKDGTLSLATAAGYGRAPRLGSLDELYLGRAEPSFGMEEVRGLFTPALPFLASLNPSQWNTLDDAPIPAANLSVAQREMAQRWVFEELQATHRSQLERQSTNALELGKFPLATEPTEVFPNGLPGEFRISLAQTNESVVLTRTTQGLAFTLSPASLGWFEAMKANPAGNPDAARRKIADYRPATRSGYQIRLRYPEGVDVSLQAIETKPVVGTRFGPRTSLPVAIRRDIDLAREAFLGAAGD